MRRKSSVSARIQRTAAIQSIIRRALEQADADSREEVLSFQAEVERVAQSWEWKHAAEYFARGLAIVQTEFVRAAQMGKGYDGEVALTRKALPGYIDGGMESEVEVNGDTLTGTVRVSDRESARLSETEIQPWDMKDALLHGPNSKESPANEDTGKPVTRYNTIMFRHQTPGTVGLHGDPMPSPVYRAAVKMDTWEYSLSGIEQGYSKRRGRLWRAEEGAVRTPTARGDVLHAEGVATSGGGFRRHRRPIKEMQTIGHHHFKVDAAGDDFGGEFESHFYEHKTNIYAGMRRMTQFYEKVRQQFYATWRRVSESWTDKDGNPHGSDDDSWWHNGLTANPISAAAVKAAEERVMALVYEGIRLDIREIIEEAASVS